MRILTISDTHTLHRAVSGRGLPPADMILHAGDISSTGTLPQISDFINWFNSLSYKHKVFIPGNHDFGFEVTPNIYEGLIPEGMHLLNNSEVTIEGLKIYGMPYTPTFYDWAFMADRGEKMESWVNLIPDDTDILLSHGPPKNILDFIPAQMTGRQVWPASNVGCEELLERVEEINPMLNIFGHIHEANGYKKIDKTLFINASSLDGQYLIRDKPYYLLEVDPINKTVEVIE